MNLFRGGPTRIAHHVAMDQLRAKYADALVEPLDEKEDSVLEAVLEPDREEELKALHAGLHPCMKHLPSRPLTFNGCCAPSSRSRRAMYLIWLLTTATFAAALLSLWLTEPALPARTDVAFGILVVINITWAGFFAWALTRRKVLYARQGVIAGRLAVLWSAVFVAGALIVGFTSGRVNGGLVAAATGLVFLGCALAVLRRAMARHQELRQLRRALEQQPLAPA